MAKVALPRCGKITSLRNYHLPKGQATEIPGKADSTFLRICLRSRDCSTRLWPHRRYLLPIGLYDRDRLVDFLRTVDLVKQTRSNVRMCSSKPFCFGTRSVPHVATHFVGQGFSCLVLTSR